MAPRAASTSWSQARIQTVTRPAPKLKAQSSSSIKLRTFAARHPRWTQSWASSIYSARMQPEEIRSINACSDQRASATRASPCIGTRASYLHKLFMVLKLTNQRASSKIGWLKNLKRSSHNLQIRSIQTSCKQMKTWKALKSKTQATIETRK